MATLYFTPGDLSGNTVLQESPPPGDKLHAIHVNELRTYVQDHEDRIVTLESNPTGNFAFNVKSYGAVGDGITDDSAAIIAARAAAVAASGTLYFPAGTYLVLTTITLAGSGWNVKGEGRTVTKILTTTNIAAFTIDCTPAGGNGYYNNLEGIGFIGQCSGTRNLNAGIRIIGTGAGNTFNYNTVHDLMFQGVTHGIWVTKSATAGQELGHDWNIYSDMIFQNTSYPTYSLDYGIKFDEGSGTGNIFTDMTMIATISCIEFGGSGDLNIGDLVFSNITMGNATDGFKFTAGATGYHSKLTFVACDIDGTVHSFNMTGMDNFRLRGCSIGGLSPMLLVNCTNYSVDTSINGSIESQYGVYNAAILTGATTSMADLTLASYSSIFVEVISTGLVQGKGATITTTRYHIVSDSTTAVVTQIDTSTAGGGTITHSTTVTGKVVTIKAAINSTVDDSNLSTGFRVIGSNYLFTKL